MYGFTTYRYIIVLNHAKRLNGYDTSITVVYTGNFILYTSILFRKMRAKPQGATSLQQILALMFHAIVHL